MKSLLLVPPVLLTLALLMACGGPQPAVVSSHLVPPNASFIVQIQLEKLLQDADFAELVRQAPPGLGQAHSLDELLEQAQREVGVDFRQFQSVLLFADVAQDGEYFGVIARGQVNQDRLLSALEDSGEYTVSTVDYAGHRVYVDHADADNPAIAFLNDEMLVLGSLAAVQDVIDVQQGNLPQAGGAVYDAFVSLGEPWFSMAMTPPQAAAGDFSGSLGGGPGFGMMPALDALADLEIVSLVVDKPGGDLKVEATLDFLTAQSANDLRYALDGFLNLAAAFTPDPETRALLERVEARVQDSRLTIKFQAPVSQIIEVARKSEQGPAGPY
jgi:hypothetical protein